MIVGIPKQAHSTKEYIWMLAFERSHPEKELFVGGLNLTHALSFLLVYYWKHLNCQRKLAFQVSSYHFVHIICLLRIVHITEQALINLTCTINLFIEPNTKHKHKWSSQIFNKCRDFWNFLPTFATFEIYW